MGPGAVTRLRRPAGAEMCPGPSRWRAPLSTSSHGFPPPRPTHAGARETFTSSSQHPALVVPADSRSLTFYPKADWGCNSMVRLQLERLLKPLMRPPPAQAPLGIWRVVSLRGKCYSMVFFPPCPLLLKV